jgi:hypothetical protein
VNASATCRARRLDARSSFGARSGCRGSSRRAALLIAIAGAAFVLSDPGRPASRFADVGTLAAYPAGAVTPLPSAAGWVDRRAGVRVWVTTEPFCEADGGWGTGPVRWDPSGVVHGDSRGGTGNLRYADAQVARGHVYVDLSRTTAIAGAPGLPLEPCARPRLLRAPVVTQP